MRAFTTFTSTRTRRLAACALVAGGLLVSGIATSATSTAAPRTGGVVQKATAKVGPVLFIGDSVGASIKWTLGTRLSAGGYNAWLDAVSGRCTIRTAGRCAKGDAWDALDALDPSFAPKLAVIELGYNDTTKSLALGVDTLMKDLVGRGVKKVLWINMSERRPKADGTSAYAPYNDVLQAKAKQWKQLTILDWNSASDGEAATSWFVPFSKGKTDLIHLKTEGQKQFAQFIRDQLDALRDAGALPDGSGDVPGSTTTTPPSTTGSGNGGDVETSTANIPAKKRPELKKGDKGDFVIDLQRALVKAGFKTDVDGQFGAGTERVVKAFQTAKGLAADGKVGPRSWKALGF